MNFLFDFVRQFSNELANLAERIEDNLFNEPHASLIQARLYSEHLVKLISKEEELEELYALKHAERIHKLYRQNAIEEDIYLKLEWIRKKGNKAVHDVKEVETADVLQTHKFLFEISVWYMQLYVTYEFKAPAYKLPIASETNNNQDKTLKLYLDQKIDDMRLEIQKQFDDMRLEKEEVKNVANLKLSATNEAILSPMNAHLQFKNEKIFIPSELADMPITTLPVNGCKYLLSEFSRVGITSLNKINEPMDELHMKLNGIGTQGMEKFWEQINSIESVVRMNMSETHDTEVKTITISEKVDKIFDKHKFKLNHSTKKAIEFEHRITKEIVYLLPNKLTTIVLHPDTAKEKFEIPDKPSHNTALRSFPKAINKGKTPTNFGYSFKFQSEEELDDFLCKLNNA
ncbi:DUF4145 domain-containing protein [Priestia aryabhattai]|uniref:DUF4145 domain-containing protein n=1 Tax=Priestia TaxID=2800373 RepID=UPI0008DD825E|nr:DUF4145 domain-containing protein [Priestia aryabhattai]MBZ6484299.1 DUF4145 domain-containing protein [Priestia aryabhattai]MDH3115322.1 DUF4145 domain-containing protein [Priestia aryabhattai]MDH3125786.1 DUF4145 domain-containing protein [Priestia aryabhattai]MDH3133997.1 DUF4145 domain-containing protein [Priestia aryabhattai]MED4154910.1 DUF4145 domain-containing protein [Priestia aryabhattai]